MKTQDNSEDIEPALSPLNDSRVTSREKGVPVRDRTPRPAALAIADRKKAELWRNLSVLVCLLALTVSYLSIREVRAGDRILVLDPAGNLLAGPTEKLSLSKGFFDLTALYCTHACLQRSAEGFDLYELLGLYFSPRAIQKLEEDWQGGRADATARNLQQKPMVDFVGEAVPAGKLRIVETRGRLIRAGAYAGRSFYEEIPFTLVLSFKKNPDLGKTAAYPWLCEDLDLQVGEARRE